MSQAPLRIALADDDRVIREILSQMLRNLGCEVVVTADNGRTLVAQCAVTRPDIVITDNLMPEMDGVDAAAEIFRARPVPIILFSEFCDRQVVLSAERKHVVLCLSKPINQEHLEAALAQCRQSLLADDLDASDEVLVSPTGEPAGEATYRTHSRPPYQQTFRRPR
jgi:two-component system, response regulator PdtaR